MITSVIGFNEDSYVQITDLEVSSELSQFDAIKSSIVLTPTEINDGNFGIVKRS